MASSPVEGREVLVIVRLSDVPKQLREKVADTIIRRGRLAGMDALEFGIAKMARRQDPVLRVPAWKAELVLREAKQPPGDMPKVWDW
jgi:hypothetical protein